MAAHATQPLFEPPPPPGTRLMPPDRLDRRPDEEIAARLRTRRAVTSERNVWAFWGTGWDTMPRWTQRNVIGWVRRLGPAWTVHVVDAVPGSETNVAHLLDAGCFPDAFNRGAMDGPTVGQHQADLVRLPLLYHYGGVWMDVGMLLFRHLDDICWRAIADPDSPYEVAGFSMQLRPGVDCMMNSFIAARRGNPLMRAWHDTFLAVWGAATNAYAPGLYTHPLLRHVPPVCLTSEQLKAPEATVSMAFLSNYLAQILCLERLRRLVCRGFNGPEYYARHVFMLPSMDEMYYLQGLSSWQGPREFALLSAAVAAASPGGADDGDAADEETREAARAAVHHLLARSAVMKLSHAPPGEVPFLADLWGRPGNEEADVAPGSFAAYLRRGSVSLDQERELVPMALPVEAEGLLYVEGLLDAAEAGGAARAGGRALDALMDAPAQRMADAPGVCCGERGGALGGEA